MLTPEQLHAIDAQRLIYADGVLRSGSTNGREHDGPAVASPSTPLHPRRAAQRHRGDIEDQNELWAVAGAAGAAHQRLWSAERTPDADHRALRRQFTDAQHALSVFLRERIIRRA